MGFLCEYGAVINIPERSVAIWMAPGQVSDEACTYQWRKPLRAFDDDVTIPPWSSALMAVTCDTSTNSENIAEKIPTLLSRQGFSIARGIVSIKCRHTHVFVTNFSSERRHLTRGTAVTFMEELAEMTA